jgi:hemerythrin-like domain-containing protein
MLNLAPAGYNRAGSPAINVFMPERDSTRRKFLYGAALITVGASASTLPLAAWQATPPKTSKPEVEEEVSPTEDLMREHGLLNRVLLVYEELERRLQGKQEFDPQALAKSAAIIRRFIEDYHEKLEENYLFPRFEKAGKLTELVVVLRAQHAAGRGLTAQLEQLATAATLKNLADREKARSALHSFVRMYRPHEAREDTVLFPALHQIISPHEFDSLGEDFEKKEHELFGEGGFEHMVDAVAGIERSLGLYELAQFTPR